MRDGAWAQEPEDLHQRALCRWRREKGRDCERIIGRGRKRGKSLPILSCSYWASHEMTQVKSQKEPSDVLHALENDMGGEGEDEEETKMLKLPTYRQHKGTVQ